MDVVTWPAAVPVILLAIAVVLFPGLLVLAPMRLGLMARLALAGSVSVAVVGVSAIGASLLGVPFSFWQPLLLAAVGGALVWVLHGRTVAHRYRYRYRHRPAWAIGLTWLGSTSVLAVVAFAAVPTAGLVSQTYDNVFHLSAIAAILEHGDASSLTLRTLIETDKTFSFYPSGWHSLVVLVIQLSAASIPVATNAVWIAVACAVWLPGVVWLAQVLLPRIAPTTVAVVALPIAVGFGAFPYGLLAWGTLYPTFLATALLPVAIAIPVLAHRAWHGGSPGRRVRTVGWGLGGTVVAAVAVAFGQPRVLVTWALLLVVPAIAVVVGWIRSRWRDGGRARTRVGWVLGGCAVVLVLGGVAAFAYLVFRLQLFERPLDDRLGGPQAQAVQTPWEGALQVLAQSALTGEGAQATAPSLLLAAAIAVGAVVAWRSRRLRWIVATYLLVAVLFVLAAGSDDVVTKLATALWYKDKFRLASALPILGVALATLGVVTVARRIARPAARVAVSAGLAWLVALTSAIVLSLSVSGTIGRVFHMPVESAESEVVSQSQVSFFASLGDTVPADQRVLGDPWDGSAWTGVFGDREPVFPHVNGQWDPDRVTLAWFLADIETDPAVCEALDRLRVRYITYSPHAFGGGDPAGNHFPGPHAAVEAGLFEVVDAREDVALYRIDQCGPLAER